MIFCIQYYTAICTDTKINLTGGIDERPGAVVVADAVVVVVVEVIVVEVAVVEVVVEAIVDVVKEVILETSPVVDVNNVELEIVDAPVT